MSIFTAVVSTNADEFEKFLQAGWTPPSIRHKHAGYVADYAVWTEVILRDWIEGFVLLDQYFPEMSLKREVWEIALKNSSIACVKFLWERNNFDATRLSDETKKAWTTFLMVGMGETWSPPHDIKDVLPVYKFLVAQGFDANAALPGDFEPSDFRIQGHSLFTRAIFIKNWNLALDFWPSSSSVWHRWPRLNEVIFHLLNVVTGDYKALLDESVYNETTEEDVLMRWLEQYGVEWLEASSDPKASGLVDFTLQVPRNHALSDSELSPRTIVHVKDDNVLENALENLPFEQKQKEKEFDIVRRGVELLSLETPETETESKISEDISFESRHDDHALHLFSDNDTGIPDYVPLYRILSRPSQEKISPWLRLPLMLQSPRRKIIWDIWERVLGQDPEYSWLHELAMYPYDPDVQNIILLARHDMATPFHRFWARPSASGFSAHERWVNMGGIEAMVQPWVPVV